jgi:hypothetical protein
MPPHVPTDLEGENVVSQPGTSGELSLPITNKPIGQAADWSDRLAALLPQPTDLPPKTAGKPGGTAIPLEDRIVLTALHSFKTWFAGQPVRARSLMEDVPEFQQVYRTANSIGTLLGKGVAGHGLGLFRQDDAYPPTYANGWQLAQRLNSAQFEQVARRLGFDGVDALAAAIRGLPGSQA